MPLIRDYPQAFALVDTDAFVFDRTGTGTMYIDASDFETGAPYIAAFEFLGGTPPIANELLGGHAFPVAVTFPQNFVGFAYHAETPPAALFGSPIYQVSGGGATQIGTMGILTSGVFTFSTSGPVTFAPGDSIRFSGQVSPDTQLANFWWTILGTLA